MNNKRIFLIGIGHIGSQDFGKPIEKLVSILNLRLLELRIASHLRKLARVQTEVLSYTGLLVLMSRFIRVEG